MQSMSVYVCVRIGFLLAASTEAYFQSHLLHTICTLLVIRTAILYFDFHTCIVIHHQPPQEVIGPMLYMNNSMIYGESIFCSE